MHINAARAAAVAGAFVAPKEMDINDPVSIRSVASTIAHGTMSLYNGNVTKTEETLAVWPAPVYWWESGGAWGSMLNYFHYTGDSTYNDVISEAILSQVGPKYDLMVPRHQGDEGNDDQAFWAFTILEAAERNFPMPDDSTPAWLDIAINAWNTMIARWDTTKCGGGIYWQIFADNPNGMTYKNSVSNGGLFQMSARLARATGNSTYVDWAQKIWNWSQSIGLIQEVNGALDVFDGAGIEDDCKKTNPVSFSYSQAIYLYGASVMYNYTNGDQTWGDRVNKLLAGTESYFKPFDNATNIMFEHACEHVGSCNTDMVSFKAWMSRFMWATTQMMPSTLSDVRSKLTVSATAAAKACSGGQGGTTCGFRWYVGGFDGNVGLGPQLSALETIQGLLISEAAPPLKAGEIKRVIQGTPTPAAPSPSSTPNGAASLTPSLTIATSAASLTSLLVATSAATLTTLLIDTNAPSSPPTNTQETKKPITATQIYLTSNTESPTTLLVAPSTILKTPSTPTQPPSTTGRANGTTTGATPPIATAGVSVLMPSMSALVMIALALACNFF